MSYDQGVALLNQLKQSMQVEPLDSAKCNNFLAQLKIILIQLPCLPPVATAHNLKELTLARDTLEMATLLSARTRDLEGFERHFSQLRTYYTDLSTVLAPSPNQYPILGLNLLYLLAHSRISQFHTELELLPVAEHRNPFVLYATNLEQYIVEGNYNKVLSARKDVPLPYYTVFMDMFLDTVRREVARSSERAYTSLPLSSALTMLMFSSADQLRTFVQQEQARREQEDEPVECIWEVTPTHVLFKPVAKEAVKVPSMRLISQALSYAMELERIV